MINRLRSHLREYYPALAAFQGTGRPGLDSRRARLVLAGRTHTGRRRPNAPAAGCVRC